MKKIHQSGVLIFCDLAIYFSSQSSKQPIRFLKFSQSIKTKKQQFICFFTYSSLKNKISLKITKTEKLYNIISINIIKS